MRVFSPVFLDGKPIPTRYAHYGVVGGNNISIPLSWSDAPAGTQSFTLSIVDPHPVANNWIHWFVINIPSNIVSLPEGASCKNMPAGSKELYNSYGTRGYGGPEPPKGSGPHPYQIVVCALNTPSLDIPVNTTLTAFRKALEEKVIASTIITGIYER